MKQLHSGYAQLQAPCVRMQPMFHINFGLIHESKQTTSKGTLQVDILHQNMFTFYDPFASIDNLLSENGKSSWVSTCETCTLMNRFHCLTDVDTKCTYHTENLTDFSI